MPSQRRFIFFLCVNFSLASAWNQPVGSHPKEIATKFTSAVDKSQCVGSNDNRGLNPSVTINTRRALILQLTTAGLLLPRPAQAGQVGAMINKAVTTSELGVAVRRSVVQGAQVMDGVDGQWERFSDRFGLGSERSKRNGRPEPLVIPDPQPLDTKVAEELLRASDDVFLQVSGIDKATLTRQVTKVDSTVRTSFERAGLVLDGDVVQTAAQFNYVCYVHFKAYTDLILERSINFRQFYPAFVYKLGGSVLEVLSSPSPKSPSSLEDAWSIAQSGVQALSKALVQAGVVAQIPVSDSNDGLPESDLIVDWANDLADLTWSIALNGDITQNAQILLQEQGFRLYPSFGKFAIQAFLDKTFTSFRQKVSIDDYYMDTDYNSDPDKFEVKQVILNVQIESM